VHKKPNIKCKSWFVNYQNKRAISWQYEQCSVHTPRGCKLGADKKNELPCITYVVVFCLILSVNLMNFDNETSVTESLLLIDRPTGTHLVKHTQFSYRN